MTKEEELNDLKEQILKDGNTSVSKRDLLERFCEIDKEYNGRPWNLLQILANINILIGQEFCEGAVSRKKLEKLKRWRLPYDTNTTIPKSDLFIKLTDIRDLPSVTPTHKKGKWIEVDTNMYTCSNCSHCFTLVPEDNQIQEFKCCPNCKTEMEVEE